MENLSQHPKAWTAHSVYGGNSNCWTGQTPRFHPDDFDVFDRYGISSPWPIKYDDIEREYSEVEQVMEIAGGSSDHIFPRSRPFPFPPHRLSRSDTALQALRPDIWIPAPTARSNGGSRAQCCANGICKTCPIDAKFTVVNGGAAFDRDGVYLLSDTEVRTVDISAGQASGIIVSGADGRDAIIRSEVVALGTNAISNAAILLRTGIALPALGRYLHEQASIGILLDVVGKNYFGGTTITGLCYGAYMGEHRSHSAAVLIENFNAPNFIRPERGRWTERMMLKLVAEDIPQAANKVALTTDDTVSLTWVGHSAYAERGIERAMNLLPEIVPLEIEKIHFAFRSTTEAHIQGTHRMGTDPSTSVVDRNCRVHGISGLYALGAGVFPACGPANPTLTLSAISLMAGRKL